MRDRIWSFAKALLSDASKNYLKEKKTLGTKSLQFKTFKNLSDYLIKNIQISQ